MVWYTVHLLWMVVLRLDCHALVDLADRLKISWRFRAESSCRWDMSWWMELALVLSPTLCVFGGWADRVSPQLSSQCEAQEEKLPSDGWEQRLRVNSNLEMLMWHLLLITPLWKKRKTTTLMFCCKWSCDTGKWQAKLKFHSCHGLTIKVLWYTPSNATINSLVI